MQKLPYADANRFRFEGTFSANPYAVAGIAPLASLPLKYKKSPHVPIL